MNITYAGKHKGNWTFRTSYRSNIMLEEVEQVEGHFNPSEDSTKRLIIIQWQ